MPPDLAARLRQAAPDLAAEAAGRHLAAHPELTARFGDRAEPRCREDGGFHLDHLAAAVAVDRPDLFFDYVDWGAELLAGLGLTPEELADHLRVLQAVLTDRTDLGPADRITRAGDWLAQGADRLTAPPVPSLPEIDTSTELGVLAAEILERLLAGDRRTASELITRRVDDGVPLIPLYLDVFTPCLREVGRLWQSGAATVGQEHFVTAAIQVSMAQLYPRIMATPRSGRSILVASVGRELHEVGGRVVADVFELSGWDSHFLGASTPTREIVEAAGRLDVDAVALSATLPRHVDLVAGTVEGFRAHRGQPVLVGGRPFVRHDDLWEAVGADASAPDALQAVAAAEHLVGQR